MRLLNFNSIRTVINFKPNQFSNIKTIRGCSLSSLGFEKALENNRIIIRPFNENEPYPEKTNLSQNTNSNLKSIKTGNKIDKSKKNGSLPYFDQELPLVNSSRSIKISKTKHLASVRFGNRRISESIDRSKNMTVLRDEYQINKKRRGIVSKEQTGTGNNKNRKVYRESNRASCIMIKKLKGDYYA